MKKFLFFIFISIWGFLPLKAQFSNPESIPNTAYQQAIELYELKQYGAARTIFEGIYADENVPDLLRKNAQYFQAICAMYLYHEDGEKLIKKFVRDNPSHPKSATAYFVLADFYFSENNYRKAVEYFEQADLDKQRKNKQIEGYYKLAYSMFARRAFDESLKYFNKIRNGEHAYAAAANYYGGFILFDQYKNEEALQYFRKAEKSESYRDVVAYLIASIYYRQAKFDELISYAEQVLEEENLRNRNEIVLLMGEAYFMKENYAQAAEYFQDYLDMGGIATDQKVLYRIAYTQYIAENFESAKQGFQQIASSNDSLAQASAYYLGNIYLNEKSLEKAANAYKQSTRVGANEAIKEEASFKLGQIYFMENNFNQAMDVLEQFQAKYPQSKRINESRELMSESLLLTNNFDRAIAYIEKLPSKTQKVREAYQEVTFLKGASLFNNGDFYAAVQTFEKSAQFPEKAAVLADTYFWMAEAFSSGKQYEEAIQNYMKALNISAVKPDTKLRIYYGLGYAYFNTTVYDKALVNFQPFVEQTENKAAYKSFHEDALLRLADAYYANKRYKLAISTYQKAISKKVKEIDYAYFQKGVVHSIIMENSEAHAALDKVINEFKQSRYLEDAIYQKALIYYESGDYPRAVDLFSKLIKDKKESSLLPYAYAKRAISYFNKGDLEQTANDYKFILNNYLTHPVASEAILGLQQALSSLERSSEMEEYIEAFKKANPEGEEIATVEFESAKSQYFNQNYDKAINSLKAYLSQYEGNTYSYDAKYYLADAYQRKAMYDEAVVYFKEVIEDNRSSFVNRSLNRLGDIKYERAKYDEAIPFYFQLSKVAINKRELYNGWAGIMESHFMLANYDSVNHYAQLILEQGNVNANAENHAYLYLGKSAKQIGNYDKARSYFDNCIKSAKDKYAAEAKFSIAQMYFIQQKYRSSLETLFELNKDFSMYEDWVSKSFMLIAENYLALGENFQARATLQSIVEGAKDGFIVKQAQAKLAEMDKEDKKKMDEQKRKADSLNQDMILLEEIDSLINKQPDIDEN